MKEVHEWFGSHRDDPDYYSRHPVMTPEMIRQLPARRALVIRGGTSPVLARLPMAWKDPVYRAACRRQRRAAGIAGRPYKDPSADGPWIGDMWPDWAEADPLAPPTERPARKPPESAQ